MKRTLKMAAAALFAWILAFAFPAWAATEGGTQGQRNGQTEVIAGVAVDYMGKLRFEVKDEATKNPIKGASVELWIPGINGGEGAYVLFGVTDENGALELDVAYNRSGQENTFETADGKLEFNGTLLYLDNNQLKYQIYKAGWLPYPKRGEVKLELHEIPQVVVVYLYQKGGGGGGHDGNSEGGSGTRGGGPSDQEWMITDPEVPLAPGSPGGPLSAIPKTGVENYALLWGIGCILMLLAAGIVSFFLWRDGRQIKSRKKRRDG